MGQLDTAACFGVLRSGGKVHGAWNGRFLPQQQGGISFFFPQQEHWKLYITGVSPF